MCGPPPQMGAKNVLKSAQFQITLDITITNIPEQIRKETSKIGRVCDRRYSSVPRSTTEFGEVWFTKKKVGYVS